MVKKRFFGKNTRKNKRDKCYRGGTTTEEEKENTVDEKKMTMNGLNPALIRRKRKLLQHKYNNNKTRRGNRKIAKKSLPLE